jgi:deoxycytidylate deaminase
MLIAMNTRLLTSIAIAAALVLVGAVVVSTLEVVSQQAFADKPSGCAHKSTGDEHSGGNCRHTGHKGN